jgi:hypothetical protein
MTPEERIRADRDAWKNAANHLMVAVRSLMQHQITDEQASIVTNAIMEYGNAKQGIKQ